MSLQTPLKVEKLQSALHAKAKRSPGFRFYSLYDKVYRKDVLEFAYRRCRANGGAGGVDAQTFGGIAEYGEARWLDELAEELRKKEYGPSPVRRVWIPKANGKQRPLGIATVSPKCTSSQRALRIGDDYPSLPPIQGAAVRDSKDQDRIRRRDTGLEGILPGQLRGSKGVDG